GPKLSEFAGSAGGRGGRGGPQAEEPAPDLSFSASRSDSDMVLSYVNPRHDVDMQVETTLRGVTATKGTAQIVHDSDINAYNSFDSGDRITIKPHEVAVEGNRVRITLPAMSVATVTLQVS